MSYPVTHVLVELEARTTIRGDGDVARARFSASGPLDVSFPGQILAWASAAYFVRVEADQGRPAQSERRTLQLTTTILTPDGQPFTAEEVTVDDLRRFRDLRGVPVGPWTYRVAGESAPVPIEGGVRLVPSEAHARIRLHEVVHSSSAPPLIDTAVPVERPASLPFDLFHVGTLEVTASPGPPVTAIALDNDRVAVFVANPGGVPYTTAGNVVPGWGPWDDVSDGSTVPGGTVSACTLSDGRIAVFLADPGAGIYSAVGSPDVGFGPWDDVAQGSTMPGAPICAVPLGSNLVRLAVADRAGGVYSIVGAPGAQDWGEWRPVSDGATVPGGAITGVRTEDGRVHLFLADVGGGVYTASCSPDGVWSGWSTVAEGATTPGGWVTSVLSPTGRIRVFLADRAGGVYGASRRDEPTWGIWSEVPGVSASPGAMVAALPDEDDTVRLILADRFGAVRSTVGSASRQWSPWEHISEGATMPGAPIGAARHRSGRVSVVVADRGFGVFGVTRTGSGWSTWKSVSHGTAGGNPRTVTVRDPDGLTVASSATGSLAMPVDLPLLNRSRDSSGGIRAWTLEVAPAAPTPTGPPVPVLAQVVASTRLDLGQVRDRIHELLGPNGEKVALEGDTTDGRARLRLTVLDRASAATLDFHGILDPVLEEAEQDPGTPTDLREDVPFTVIDASASLGYGVELDLDALRVTALRVDVGASAHLSGTFPAVRVEVAVEGEAVARIAGFPLATARVRGATVSFEIGLRLGADGEFASDTWISGDGSLIDVDIHWAAALAAGVVSPAGALTAAVVLELVESSMNDLITSKVQRLAAGGLRGVRHAFARFLGADFTYLSIGIDADDLVLAYLAPIEQQPTPSPIYRPVNGRAVDQVDGRWQVTPDERGDTWANEKLLAHIGHIVMVMMENRSYDHVLGRHAVGEGLDDEVLALLAGAGSPARHLASSGITPNGVGLRTRFPAPVGHSLADVTEQLSVRATLPSGREVNAPTGFLSNFGKRLERQSDEVKAQLEVADVLGYYTTDDLAFFRHLTSHYAWSDRFYCSHPGPTLPNRMLSLVGDLQYTRSGEAVLDNNHGEEFYLSRATTIFDLLTRRGVDWRVYESFPSVTMLRMFARYAGDRDRILRVERFADDVLSGDLPPFTVVDPAMHHKPQTDDHPVADMYRGQQFLDTVYRALRANERVWERTLLLITYDEHGGFYDHVVPPVAEILDDGSSSVLTPYGVRVPTFVVSPWVPAGPGPGVVLDHCSILKTVLARFCPDTHPFLSDRVHAASSFEDFLTEPAPRLDVPMPPPLPPLPDNEALHRIVTDPVFRRDMRLGNVDYHDLTGMLARSLGRDKGQA